MAFLISAVESQKHLPDVIGLKEQEYFSRPGIIKNHCNIQHSALMIDMLITDHSCVSPMTLKYAEQEYMLNSQGIMNLELVVLLRNPRVLLYQDPQSCAKVSTASLCQTVYWK